MDHDEMKAALKRATEDIPTHGDGRFVLWQADCREALARLDDNSVDAIVTDPPYGLEFMGKEWDAPWKQAGTVLHDPSVVGGFQDGAGGNPFSRSRIRYGREGDAMVQFQAWFTEIATEALRVLKPGGHLLAFGGSRTYHRLACAVEDAGFEIRDQIMWVYGSGFPKSLDVGKAIDKMDAREEQEARRLRFTAWVRSTGVTAKQIDEATGTNMGGHYTTAASQPAIMTREHLEACRHLLGDVPEWVEREADIRSVESRNFAEREVVGTKTAGIANKDEAQRHTIGAGKVVEVDITAPATDAAKQWDGWGTALKPAHEPIVVARKPLEGTVAANVLKWGTGALNIDGTRVGDEGGTRKEPSPDKSKTSSVGGCLNAKAGTPINVGRWPANFIHDGSDEVMALAGDAARFFYCAKAGKKERNAGLNLCRCDKLSHTDKQEQSWENEDQQAPHPTGTDQSHRRDTGASMTTPSDDSAWSTSSSGNSTTVQSPQDAKSTTSTTTNSTTESKTCNSSPQPNTSASIQGANSATVNGGSPARSVAKSSASAPMTGTSASKGGPSMGDADPATSPSSSNRSGEEKLWCANCGGLRGGHATVKPIALMRYLIRLVTPPGGVVLDPFAGSGTTMVAALLEGATPWGCEMTEEYVPIILGRVQWALDEIDSRLEGTL